MKAKEAFEIYKKVRAHIAAHREEIYTGENWFPEILKQLPGLSMIGPWRAVNDTENSPTFFDKCEDEYFEGYTNDSSDELCTVALDGVFINVWIHFGILSVGCSFGFTDEDGYLNLCGASNVKGPDDPVYRVFKKFVDDEAFYKKLEKLNIYDEGERWVLERNGKQCRYRSLNSLRIENGLDYNFDLEGITTAELQKHENDHIG